MVGSGDGVAAQPTGKHERMNLMSTKRQSISPSLRFKVLQRDDYTCRYCGAVRADGAVFQIDHVAPVSKGGTNDIANLVTACTACNAGKSADPGVSAPAPADQTSLLARVVPPRRVIPMRDGDIPPTELLWRVRAVLRDRVAPPARVLACSLILHGERNEHSPGIRYSYISDRDAQALLGITDIEFPDVVRDLARIGISALGGGMYDLEVMDYKLRHR